MILGIGKHKTRLESLEEASMTLINSGVDLSHYGKGYVLKKLITECIFLGSNIDHEYFVKIKENQKIIYLNYLSLSNRKKNKDKDDLYWLSTMGFDRKKEEMYKRLLDNNY